MTCFVPVTLILRIKLSSFLPYLSPNDPTIPAVWITTCGFTDPIAVRTSSKDVISACTNDTLGGKTWIAPGGLASSTVILQVGCFFSRALAIADPTNPVPPVITTLLRAIGAYQIQRSQLVASETDRTDTLY